MTASRPTIGPIPIVSLAVPRSLVAEADELPKETAEIAVLAGILGRRWRLTVRGTLLQGNNGWISRRELMNMKPSLVVFIIRRRDVDASRQETPFFSLSIQTRLSLSRGFFLMVIVSCPGDPWPSANGQANWQLLDRSHIDLNELHWKPLRLRPWSSIRRGDLRRSDPLRARCQDVGACRAASCAEVSAMAAGPMAAAGLAPRICGLKPC